MWIDISQAPKDGTVIDLWHKDGFRMPDLWWTDDVDEWCGFYNSLFTHFMIVSPPNFNDRIEAYNKS